MNATIDRCFSFVHGQTAPRYSPAKPTVRRAVTISRQAGCGAIVVAEKLAQYLQKLAPPDGFQWTVFDRDLMEKVLADHDLPKYLAHFLPENRVSVIEDALAEMFGVHPPAHAVIEQTAETMKQLARLGGAILIGRAGNIVTAGMPNVLHVRLVAPLEDRIERISRDAHKTQNEARRFCLEDEHARARYAKTYLHVDINDALLYDLVINVSSVGCENTARIIGDAVLRLGVEPG